LPFGNIFGLVAAATNVSCQLSQLLQVIGPVWSWPAILINLSTQKAPGKQCLPMLFEVCSKVWKKKRSPLAF